MGMHVKEGVGFAVLVDSTMGIAFGPLFRGEHEVEDFCDWLQAGRHTLATGGPSSSWASRFDRDLRRFGSIELINWLGRYRDEIEKGTWPL